MAYTASPDWTVPVYSADPGPSGAWVDIDLSGVIGAAGRYLVFVAVEHWDIGDGEVPVAIRPRDLALEFRYINPSSNGIAFCDPYYIGEQQIIAQNTDGASVIQVRIYGTRGIRVYLLGWVPWTYVDGEVFADALLPVAWADLDISATLGHPGKNVVLLRLLRTNAAAGNYAMRRNGEVGDIISGDVLSIDYALGSDADACAALMVATDENQVVEHRQLAAGIMTGSITLQGRATDWTPVEQIIFGPAGFPGGAAGVWQDLDLSSLVGKRAVVVVLKISRSGAIADRYIDFRPNGVNVNYLTTLAGSTDDVRGCSSTNVYNPAPDVTHIVVPTDENGVVEWCIDTVAGALDYTVEVEGYLDLPLPTLAVRPSPLSRNVVATLDLSQAAATYDALTAQNGDVIVEGISFYVNVVGAVLTSVSVQTNQTNPTTILTATEGALAKLLVQKNLDYAFARFPFQLRSGQNLQYTIAGGGGSGSILMLVSYRPATPGSGAGLV